MLTPDPASVILFLDIDDVLNSEEWLKAKHHRWLKPVLDQEDLEVLANWPAKNPTDSILFEDERGDVHIEDEMKLQGYWSIDPEKVALLKEATAGVNVTWVLSSSWRWWYTPREVEYLLTLRGFPGVSFRGRTEGTGKMSLHGRDPEIKWWLNRHKPTVPWVILDDADFSEALAPYHIQTEYAVGMTPKEATRLREMLLNPVRPEPGSRFSF